MVQVTPLPPGPPSGEVHIWVVNLRGADKHLSFCAAAVSELELERAERFRFQRLRRRFLLAHGCLRTLLARYLNVPGSEVQFGYKSYGKPFVSAPATELRFNQSDSGELAAFAFSMGCELGVDIEAIRAVPNMEDIAARFFSRPEVVDLFSLPAADRRQAFYAAWTRKEAYIKAVGDGLQIPLDAFSVTLRPGDEARLIHIGDDPRTALDWQLHAFDPAEGFLGALAYLGRRRRIRLFQALDASDLLDGASVARV